jgi:hypothetical protein
MRKKHGSVPKLHTRSGLDSHNERTHWHSKCHYKRNSGSPSAGTNNPTPRGKACGATEGRQVVRRHPLQQWRRRRLLLRGPSSGSTDLGLDAAARRPPPVPKLVRQGRAEGHRVGGQPVAGPGHLAGSRTSSSCRGGCRHREWLRSHSHLKARHAAAASATDDGRLSLWSLSEGAGRRPRGGRPQLGALPSPALVMKILEAEGGEEAAAWLAFPHHQVGGRHLSRPPAEGSSRAA